MYLTCINHLIDLPLSQHQGITNKLAQEELITVHSAWKIKGWSSVQNDKCLSSIDDCLSDNWYRRLPFRQQVKVPC